ncbi:LOW QUALITY PROTEIN: hypothetical protein PHMEG_0005729 [Phytophthora megakarya]|uniref:Serine protease n=1 Tax=Phytophthora megakarya TaxID=4795 RepID=A0A225WS76_9STRA|nr:LOW QUALITY PROTEIN: hypothetical protein PHMEG_0005729 [Phytophthora megakarya]
MSHRQFILRRMLGALLENSIQRTYIASVVYRLHRCGSEDTPVLTNFIERINWFRNLGTEGPGDGYWSSALYYLITYSEINQHLSECPAVAHIGCDHYCAFSKDTSEPCSDRNISNYEAHGIIYERDEYWNKSATIPNQARVLLLSGKLDAVTPVKYAK